MGRNNETRDCDTWYSHIVKITWFEVDDFETVVTVLTKRDEDYERASCRFFSECAPLKEIFVEGKEESSPVVTETENMGEYKRRQQ